MPFLIKVVGCRYVSRARRWTSVGSFAKFRRNDGCSPVDAGVDWQDLIHAIRERLWMVILCLALAAIAATLYMRSQRQEYQARSVLFIEQTAQNVLDKTHVQAVQDDTIVSIDMINTVVDLLRSFPFAERVAARMKLQKDPRFLAGLTEKPTTELTASDAGNVLRGAAHAEYRLKTRLIDIFVTLPDPSLATEVANTYADEYIRYGFEKKAEMNKSANQYLIEESERLRHDLKVSEEAMQSFRERNGAASFDNMVATAQNKIAELNKNLTDIENKSLQLDDDLKVAAVHPNDTESLLSLPSVASYPKVQELNAQIADLDRQFTLLKQRYRAKHPNYISTQTQLASLTRDRNQVLQDVVGLLKSQRQQLRDQHESIKQLRDKQQSDLLATTGKTVEYNELERTVTTNKTMLDSVNSRIAQIGLTQDQTDSPVRMHERAGGAAAVQVSAVKVYSLGLVLGLLAGLGVALGLHFMDRSVKTIDQAERLSGVPVLTAVPRKGRKGPKGGYSLDMITDRDGIVAESFRTLRTSLAMTSRVEDRKVFMFTSAVPSEGKTFCSSNFAVTLAHQGFKTLLIDCDLRRPMVSRVFFGEQRKPGVVDILAGQCTLRDAAQDTEVEDLKVLTAGNRAPNPAELLSAGKLIGHAQGSVPDVRPGGDRHGASASGERFAAHRAARGRDVSGAAFVQARRARRSCARSRRWSDIRCRPVGVVFNFMPTGAGSYYYYSGKYHGDYGTKGVYGT